MKQLVFVLVAIMSLFWFNIPATAQLRGTHLLGDAGLQSGSLPSPSVIPFTALYNYHTSAFLVKDGDKVNIPDINMFMLGLGGSVVTRVKILGANYGFSVLVGFASNRIEGDSISAHTALAFTDTYIQPVQLGWKTSRADFTFSYALYLPTGEYELGGSSNSGLGILSNEFAMGTTLFFNQKKEWNGSALFSYALNSPKKNTKDNKIIVGDLLSIEGGIGKTWYRQVKSSPLPMIINAGLVYYLQFKTTQDKMDVPSLSGTPIVLAHKDYISGLGAEVNIFIPKLRSSIGARWLGEPGGRNRTQGNAFFITLSPCITFFNEQ